MILHFKRFTRPSVLQRLGRGLLGRFLERFADDLASRQLRLPSPEAPDEVYFGGWARLLAAPEALPDALSEALFAIHELAGPDGQEQLELAAARLGLEFCPASSREDMAMQLWLAAPEALARAHNQQRLRRLTTFESFGSDLPAAQRPAFEPPGEASCEALRATLDDWFSHHQRGRDTTRVELYALPARQEGSPGEYWFLIRHGDAFVRAPKVEARHTEILHFRPERDDVLMYSPQHDEIRVNARTKGERDLYVRAFGRCLRGRENYFCRRPTYTLEPLRAAGPEALDPAGLEGIHRIVLRQIELAWDNPIEGRTVRQAGDLFGTAAGPESLELLLSRRAQLARAVFDIRFAGAARPRTVEIRLPNVLKLGRHCDALLVDQWLSLRGFRLPPKLALNLNLPAS